MARAKQKLDREPGWEKREEIAAKQRENRRRRRHTGDIADWSSANADLLSRAICDVTSAGCAIQFGYTQDGGAMVVRIVGDGEPFNEFVRPTEDVDLYLQTLCEDYGKG